MKRLVVSFFVSLTFLSSGFAATISQWTFETSQPSQTGGTTLLPIVPESGAGNASGVHADVLTSWSSPAGNGSAHSFSADRWAVNGYFQFQASTIGFQNIQLSWDQTRSTQGPATWNLSYSTDGTTFTPYLTGYAPATGTWSTFNPDLSSITVLNNASTAYFRLTATAAPGGIPSTAETSAVDNFTVIGTVIPVPEPQNLFFFGGLGLLALHMFRRRSR